MRFLKRMTAAAMAWILTVSAFVSMPVQAAESETSYSASKWAGVSIPSVTTSEGIQVYVDMEKDTASVPVSSSSSVSVFTITVEIPEGFEGNADVNISEAVAKVYSELAPLMPGELIMFQIRIINHSAHKYEYKTGSFTISDGDLNGIDNEKLGVTHQAIAGVVSYSGKPISTYAGPYRNVNKALRALYTSTPTPDSFRMKF